MRKKIVVGNWKMNKSLEEGESLVDEIIKLEKEAGTDNVLKLIATPSTHFTMVADQLKDRADFSVAAQNCHHEKSGAYTGEVSASMIASARAQFVIVGHSERREYFLETNAQLANKLNLVLENGLHPIYCVGEKNEERESNSHFDIVKQQLVEGVFHLDEIDIKNVIIAYEPVWAIGTGLTATADQAQEIHHFIRGAMAEKYNQEIADSISILYGGSCNVGNAKELFSCEDIDGGLIGGASLKAADFVKIISSF